jgi:predicted ATPase/DNA-binding CsgD family transcriptional regulator
MLVEREQPVQELLDLAKSAITGRGAIALVGGEAGIGKTSVLEEMRLRASADCTVMWGGCDALFTPRALGPIHDMAPALGREVTQLLAEGSQSSRLFAAVLRHIETSREPTVLVFEDVHWADHATLDLLKYLGRRVSMLRTLLVMSFRADEISSDHPLTQVLGELPPSCTHRIDLLPLTREGVTALGAPSGHVDDEIYQITGGNPFFVTELLACREDFYEAVPVSVKDAVGARLNRLAPVEREFLETISVIPGPVPRRILHPLFGDSGETLAMACVGRNLLMQDVNRSLRFRHELARLATLSRISASTQKATHAHVLDALLEDGQEPALDQLVHHAAGALDAKRVLHYAPRAAAKATAVGAHREAAAHLATALKFIDEADPEIAAQLYEDWAYEAGLALHINDEVLEARRHAITLWRAIGRMDKVGENLRWLSRLHWYRGEAAEAGHFADEAVRVLENTPPSSERAMAYSLRSQLHMLNDRMDEAVDWGNRALKLAAQFENDEVRIHALNNVGTALIFRDKPEGIELLEESLALALQVGHHEHAARVYTNLAEYGVDFRNFELAERIIRDGISFDTQHDLDSWTHYLVGRLAQLRMEQGRLRDAETIARGVLKLDRLTLLMKLPALIVLARVRLRMSAPDAPELGAKALQDAMATDESQYVVPALFGLIEGAWLNDKPQAAAEHLQRLANVGAAQMHPWNIGEASVWAKRLGIRLPDDFHVEVPAPYAAEIEGDYVGAANAWESLGAPYSAALCLMQAGAETTGPIIARAIKLLEPIEARAAAIKARKTARTLGLAKQMPRSRRGHYGAAKNHPLGLTKREQDILALVANGATNREISETFARSQRTIEHHVSSVLSKLNVANRMEAMLRVQNEPWLIPDDGDKDIKLDRK